MIAPLVPYGIRGALWYQGESNNGEGMLYADKMKALIHGWRKLWSDEALPFYFVQIAPFTGYGNRGPASASAELREAQFQTYRDTPRSGLVVITDITGNLADIHPENKQDVGSRLARWALTHDYGRPRPFSGPLYKRSEIEGDAIRIHFDHADGLAARGNALTEFTIAGTNGVFSPATALIDGETVLVSSTNVPSPAYVRFGWADASVPNLFNGAGLPASPFRTDHLPRVTEAAKW